MQRSSFASPTGPLPPPYLRSRLKRVLNEWQSQQIAKSITTLRTLNRRAAFELQLALSPYAYHKSYQQAGETCALLAIQINSKIEFLEDVLAPDPAARCGIRFGLSRLCGKES